MGHQTLVYGAIEVFHSRPSKPDADTLNDAALLALPEQDEWPFLVRSMFSMTSSVEVNVAYTFRVIHFGASFKAIELEWEAWLVKFERLLESLDGIAAVVHLETELVGNHRYTWQRKTDSIDSWPPVWDFGGGTRSF
ncbi:hypothetical protein [Variovorax sp.]|jgi:hypothetical protein|uniref:hypothetical protein n=1 Tax=Variovorax sp. TaxID=1871043 RepID=UPI00120FAC50|nr:hypothetical protein [Variovorax sp.]TAJ58272.1 MAG: hypothetical protein EPO53_34085 [Variovorax sp.]